MFRIRWLVALAVAFALTPAHAKINAAELADSVARLQYAWYVEDSDELLAIAEELEGETASGDADKWRQYYAAYGYFRAAILTSDDYFSEYVERCEDTTKALLKKDREFVEGLILRGACAAVLAERHPVAAVFAPSRAVRSFAKARQLEPDNPRLLLQQAEASVGRKALRDEYPQPVLLLEQAISRYELGTYADPLTPKWGEADAFLLLAKLQKKAGNKLRARDAIEQALQIVPNSAVARRVISELRGQRG